MHSVPHPDRLSLDGTWRFQLLGRPDAEPAATGATHGPGPWTMRHVGHAALHERPDAVRRSAAGRPGGEPDGCLRADFDLPASWAGRRVVLHVGAAESVLHRRAQRRRRSGMGKDSHLAAEFDVTDLRPTRREHRSGCAS